MSWKSAAALVVTACVGPSAAGAAREHPLHVFGVDVGPVLQDHEAGGTAQARASLFPVEIFGLTGRVARTVGVGADATAVTAGLSLTNWRLGRGDRVLFEASAGLGRAWLDGARPDQDDEGTALRLGLAWDVLPDGRGRGRRWELSWLRVDTGDGHWDAPAFTWGLSWGRR